MSDVTSNDAPDGRLKIDGDVLASAKLNNAEAIETMFRQFLGPDDPIREACYLGTRGIWKFGHKSFACASDRKLATIQTGFFGRMLYQEGYIDRLESAFIFQPSLIVLYLISTGVLLFLLMTMIGLWQTIGWPAIFVSLGVVALPIIARLYYRFFKSGLVATPGHGLHIYIFANRRYLNRLNRLWRFVDEIKRTS